MSFSSFLQFVTVKMKYFKGENHENNSYRGILNFHDNGFFIS